MAQIIPLAEIIRRYHKSFYLLWCFPLIMVFERVVSAKFGWGDWLFWLFDAPVFYFSCHLFGIPFMENSDNTTLGQQLLLAIPFLLVAALACRLFNAFA